MLKSEKLTYEQKEQLSEFMDKEDKTKISLKKL